MWPALHDLHMVLILTQTITTCLFLLAWWQRSPDYWSPDFVLSCTSKLMKCSIYNSVKWHGESLKCAHTTRKMSLKAIYMRPQVGDTNRESGRRTQEMRGEHPDYDIAAAILWKVFRKFVLSIVSNKIFTNNYAFVLFNCAYLHAKW